MRYFIFPFVLGCGMGLTTTYNVYDEDTATANIDEPSEEPAEPSNPEDTADTNWDSDDPSDSGGVNEPESTDTDDNSPIVIADINPPFGPTTGGTIVTINGGPFDTSTSVTFGGTAGTVLSNNGSTLQVSTPIYPNPIPEEYDIVTVDLQITTSIGSKTAAEGYDYFRDNSGYTGMIGYLNYLTLTGTYWGGASHEYASGMVAFIKPTDVQWWELEFPSIGSCVSNGQTTNTSVQLMDVGSNAVSLHGGSGTTYLYWDPTSGYFHNSSEDSLVASTLSSTDTYDLAPFTSGNLSGFFVDELVQTSSSPIVTYPSISASNAPYVSQNQNFSWVQSGASWIVIRMDIRDPNQTTSLDSVHCISYDTGSFTVDSSKWNPSIPWSPNYQVDILFSRVTETVVTLPHDNSSGRMIGQHTLYGAGTPN